MVQDLLEEKVLEVVEDTAVPHLHLLVKLKTHHLLQLLVLVVLVQILVQVMQGYQIQEF
tara:strand:- start:199 stop:375 length:177 start_codon:yes stop_codon:yes gene_type:complete